MKRIQHMSYIIQATDGVSPVENEGTRGVKFGIVILPGDFPGLEYLINATYHGDNREADDLYIYAKKVEAIIPFVPTDGVMVYLAYCDNAAGEGGVVLGGGIGDNDIKTMIPIKLGDVKNFTIRTNFSDGTRRHAIDIIDIRIFKHSSHVNYMSTSKEMQDTVIIQALAVANSGYQGDVEPAYADGQAESTQNNYRVDLAGHSVLWDGEELKPYMRSWDYSSVMINAVDEIQANLFPFKIRSGDIIYAIGMEFLAQDTIPHAMYEDFLAQAATGKTHVFKIYQTATQYRQYTFSNCFISKMAIPWDVKTPVYRPIIIAQSLVIVEKDGVESSASSFYGVTP